VIGDIFFSWNELTITLVAWFVVVSGVVAADFGPEIYREKKDHWHEAHVQTAPKPTFDPDKTMKLGVFVMEKKQKHGRHARA